MEPNATDIRFDNLQSVAEQIRQTLDGKTFTVKTYGSARDAVKNEIADCKTFGDQVYVVQTTDVSFSMHLRCETLTGAEVVVISKLEPGRELPLVSFEENLIGMCYQTGVDWVIIQVEIKGE